MFVLNWRRGRDVVGAESARISTGRTPCGEMPHERTFRCFVYCGRSMRGAIVRFGIATWLAGLLPGSTQIVSGQQTGSVIGRTLDQTGGGLPGVTIDLVNGATVLTAVSDDSGVYRFEGV